MTLNLNYDTSDTQYITIINDNNISGLTYNILTFNNGDGYIYPIDGDYKNGTMVRFIATPSNANMFEKWDINGIEYISNVVDIIIDSDIIATAYYTEIEVVIYANRDMTSELNNITAFDIDQQEQLINYGDNTTFIYRPHGNYEISLSGYNSNTFYNYQITEGTVSFIEIANSGQIFQFNRKNTTKNETTKINIS